MLGSILMTFLIFFYSLISCNVILFSGYSTLYGMNLSLKKVYRTVSLACSELVIKTNFVIVHFKCNIANSSQPERYILFRNLSCHFSKNMWIMDWQACVNGVYKPSLRYYYTFCRYLSSCIYPFFV